MRFLIKGNDPKKLMQLIVPAQTYFSIADFHKYAYALADDHEFEGNKRTRDLLMYKFSTIKQSDDGPVFIRANIGQREILGKNELWHKYRGPKGVEATLKFREKYKGLASQYLDELMEELCIEELYLTNKDKSVEKLITNFPEVDIWYRECYENCGLARQITEALKGKTLPGE